MLYKLLSLITSWITLLLSTIGPFGVAILMAIESACIPLPSEVIMPFAGFLAYKNQMTFFGLGQNNYIIQICIAALFGTIGCNIGSIPAYEFGVWSANNTTKKCNQYKFFYINNKYILHANSLFHRFSSLAILLGRILPIIRTFISVPAGIAKVNRIRFHIYTFLGSFIWCFGLACVGYFLGEEWHVIERYFKQFHMIFLSFIVILACWFFYALRNNN